MSTTTSKKRELVIAAFDAARASGKSDEEAFAAAQAAAPNAPRRVIQNALYNHLGRPNWRDPENFDVFGYELQMCSYFALADDEAKEVYIGETANPTASTWSNILSNGRRYPASAYRGGMSAPWIASVFAAKRSISIYLLEEIEVRIPTFSRRRRRYANSNNWLFLGIEHRYVWSYVALRAGYTFAIKHWYDRWIPEEQIDRDDALILVNARSWPKEPVKIVTE